jgi:hypothetical protein
MKGISVFKILRLSWGFYLGFIISSLIITMCCSFLFWEYRFDILMTLIWLKIATLVITFVFINSYKGNEYYYYQNLGISKILLWTCSLLIDLIIFAILMYFANRLM